MKLPDEKIKNAFDACSEKANEFLADQGKFDLLMKDAEDIASDIPVLGPVLSDLMTMIALAKSYIHGEYRDVPTKTVIAIIATAIYVVSPVDLIPDAIPVAGYVDDAAMVAFVLRQIGKDVESYRDWRNEHEA